MRKTTAGRLSGEDDNVLVVEEVKIEGLSPRLLRLRALTSWEVIGTVYAMLAALAIGLSIGLNVKSFFCFGCNPSNATNLLVSLVGIFLFVCFAWEFWLLRDEPDIFSEKKEIVSTLLLAVIGVILYEILSATDPGSAEADGKFNWAHVNGLAFLGSFTITFPLQLYLANKYNIVLAAVEKGASADPSLPTLSALLKSEAGQRYFKAHIVSEFSAENFAFYIEATNWRQLTWKREGDRAMAAQNIYDNFLDRNSESTVNLSWEVVHKVEEGLAENPLNKTLFDEAIDSTFLLMQMDSLPRFYKSKYYKLYLLSNTDIPAPSIEESFSL